MRRARVPAPRAPGGEVNIQVPPDVPRVVPGSLLMKMMPVVMVVAVVGMISMMVVTGGRNMLSNPLFMMFPMMMLMSMFGMYAGSGNRGGKRAAELNEERKDYFRYLCQIRDEVHDTGAAQREALEWSHPEPVALLGVVGGRRMWERRRADSDFGHVRVGVGSQRLATRLMPPETGPLEDIEPVSAVALRRFVRTHSVVHGLPTAVSLRGFPAINIEGARQETRQLARSMVLELCAFHGPDQLMVAVVTADPGAESWDWCKWLPHVQHPYERDGMGSARMIYRSLTELEDDLAVDLLERGRFSRSAPPSAGRVQLVIVIDDGFVSGDERVIGDAGMEAVSILDLSAPPDGLAVRRGLQLVVRDGKIGARSAFGVEEFADMDSLTVAEAEAFARSMARYRLATAAQMVNLEQEVAPSDPGLMSLLGVADATRLDPHLTWAPRSARSRLRVPIGYSTSGTPVEIDIKEAAEGGMGPHGLCIGATGSGKSEFLRTLVLSLVSSHSPEALNLVLVDFKGGATFLGLDSCPHVAAVITNLEEELSMVDRMRDALSGEMNRRQEVLRAAGNFANVGEYERARAAGAPLEPLPALFIVVDEFSELLAQKPDFADLFVAIGRLGRSLHIHLLLASQRLEEGKMRGLDSHLSYRIGLKTFSANESRSVLGVPDAYHLPNVPGSGYLKCDSAEPIRFNTCYVSAPYSPPVAAGADHIASSGGPVGLKMFTAGPVPLDPLVPPVAVDVAGPDSGGDPEPPAPNTRTLLEIVVDRIAGQGRPAHEVWLPPLGQPPTIDMLAPHWRTPQIGRLVFPIGIVDRPYDQRRDVLTVDVAGSRGNVAIVGGPQSGKSNAVRALIVAAAATHTPAQVQFYCLDFGGGSLAGIAGLPHVGSVASRSDMDAVRRTVAEVATVIRQRELRFAELGIESMRDYRQRRLTGDASVQADVFGDLFLVVDGYSVIRGEFDFLDEQINTIVAQGLSYGVHVVLTAARWAEIRPAVKDLIGSRLELRLGDPLDSEMGRKVAGLVPEGRPGRGLTAEHLHMLIALPRTDSDTSLDSLSAAVAQTVQQLVAVYPGQQAMPVRKLAAHLERSEVVARVHDAGIDLTAGEVAIGVGEAELAPVILDFRVQPHFLVFADVEHGKTTLLRNIVAGLVENSTATQTKIVLVDYRRTMLGVIDTDHLAGYASSAQTLTPMVNELVAFFTARIPGENVTQQQLRDRNWWSGPDVYIIVDDYDMVATGSGNPLSPLLDLLAQARDIGLHLIVARRSGGAGRALFDPIIGRLKDLSTDGLLMSGDRDEGYLLGRVRLQRLVPGRGELVSRSRPQEMIQVAHMPPL
ncbi:type VII secretion protein EccC [Williamsia muralis]|uniref:Type VII secretion protein EccC n=1 Tax=Williamsia marianensis TaxID=85044 RepID=A0A2G3PVG5_WILMA|nr:type VII secretion protein EccC [Williamsia marianensis]